MFKESFNKYFFLFFFCWKSINVNTVLSPVFVCNMELGQSMFPSGGEWIKQRSTPLKLDPSIPSSHGRPEPIRDADCEVMLPLTFDEVASLLLTWPRAGERPCFMSWHDSNTIIRSWHRASLSEGERGQSAGWVQEAWEPAEAQETQHDRQTQHMWTGRKTEGYAHTYGYFHKCLTMQADTHAN